MWAGQTHRHDGGLHRVTDVLGERGELVVARHGHINGDGIGRVGALECEGGQRDGPSTDLSMP